MKYKNSFIKILSYFLFPSIMFFNLTACYAKELVEEEKENPLVAQAKELQTGSEKVGINIRKAIDLLRKASDQGDAEAMYLLAQYYKVGHPSYMPYNTATARKLLLNSAKARNNDAFQQIIKEYYTQGLTIYSENPEFKKMIQSLIIFIEQQAKSDPYAKYQLAFIAATNADVSSKEACHLYLEAYRAGYEKSAIGLLEECDDDTWKVLKVPSKDKIYKVAEKYKQQELKQLRLIQHIAQSENPDVRAQIAFLDKAPYFYELNFSSADSRRLENAIKSFYEMQGSQGFSDAYIKLSEFDNYENKDEWLMQAAKQQNPLALAELGKRYLGFAEDPENKLQAPQYRKQGIEYLHQSSELGNSEAMNRLAQDLLNQHGVRTHLNQAMNLFRKSANLGNVDAMEYMAIIASGEEGFVWATKAYENGSSNAIILPKAQQAYLKGIGVPKNLKISQEIEHYLNEIVVR